MAAVAAVESLGIFAPYPRLGATLEIPVKGCKLADCVVRVDTHGIASTRHGMRSTVAAFVVDGGAIRRTGPGTQHDRIFAPCQSSP